MKRIPFIIFVVLAVGFSYAACFVDGKTEDECFLASFISLLFALPSGMLAFEGSK